MKVRLSTAPLLLLLALVLLIVGYVFGDSGVILRKAVVVCLECIGVG